MKDPRIAMDTKGMPFDMKRMVYGGFKTLVDLAPASASDVESRRPAREPSGTATRDDRASTGGALNRQPAR